LSYTENVYIQWKFQVSTVISFELSIYTIKKI